MICVYFIVLFSHIDKTYSIVRWCNQAQTQHLEALNKVFDGDTRILVIPEGGGIGKNGGSLDLI